jgi:DHA1 family tetracycline resistance protein-like MFS transporter
MVAKLCLSKLKERKKHSPLKAGNGLKFLAPPINGISNPSMVAKLCLSKLKERKKHSPLKAGNGLKFLAPIQNGIYHPYMVANYENNAQSKFLFAIFVAMSIKNPRTALLFVLITICMDSIGVGIIIPSFPTLVSQTAHVSLEGSAKYFGWVMGAYAFMQFLFSPLIGNLSDRFGRRPILLTSVLGMGLDYLVMYFAPDLFWLVLGRAISGIFGASFTSAAAYIADISTPETTAKNFGLIGAAFGIGFVIGPAIGGLLTDFGPRAPFMAAAIFSLTNFVFGLFVLKESLPRENRRKFEFKRANPFGAFRQMARFKKVKYLFVVTFLVLMTNFAVHNTWNYFTMEKFGWSEKEVGYSLAVVGVCFGIVQGALSGVLVNKLGEKGAATLGLIVVILTMVGIGMIPYGWMLYVIILPYSFSGIVDPSIRTIVSADTPSNEQGELQGVFTSIMSLAEIIAPPFYMWIYYSSRNAAPNAWWSYGVPFFIAMFIGSGALALLRWALKDFKHKEKEITSPIE